MEDNHESVSEPELGDHSIEDRLSNDVAAGEHDGSFQVRSFFAEYITDTVGTFYGC